MRVNVRPVYAVVTLAILAVIAITASVSLFLWDLRSRELAHSRSETVSMAKLLMVQTQHNLEDIDAVLLGLQERLQTPFGRSLSLDSAAAHLLLATRVSGLQQVQSVFVVDRHGMRVNSSRTGALNAMSVADRSYFTRLKASSEEGLFMDQAVHNRLNGAWTLYLARRLNDAGGQFRGVVVAAFDLGSYEKSLADLVMDMPRPMTLYKLDGALLASWPHLENQVSSLAPARIRALVPLASQGVKSITHTREDGATEMFAIGRLTPFPLLVSVTNNEEMSLATWRDTASRIGLGAGLVTLLIAMVAAALLRELLREERLSLALSDATARYQHAVDSVMDAMVAIDSAQKIVLFNPAAERMFARHAKDVLGQPLTVLMPERMRLLHGAHMVRFSDSSGLSREMAPQMEIVGMRSDGVEFPIESTISRTHIGGAVQMTAVLRDVSEHRRNEAELRKMNAQLRELSTALQEVREQERARISRELHDELGQKLTGLKLDLSWLGSRLKEGRAADPAKVDAMRHLLDETIASVRRLSTELRPLILDDQGLGEAVAWQAREVTERSGLAIAVDMPAAALVHQDALATALFRIAQESMTNAVRHARATQLSISLTADADALRLQVSDNGDGFDVNIKSPGIGLVSMRERAVAMGGQFSIVSAPGQGVVIAVVVPFDSVVFQGDAS